MAIVKVLARIKRHNLALSEVTLNEHCAHYENRLRRAFMQERKNRAEINALGKMSGHEKYSRWNTDSSSRIEGQVKSLSESYRSRIRGIFETIDLDGDAAIEALRREALRLPPASTSFEVAGTGARDAAIWLSLVKESARSSEKIYFVSADKRAFINPDLTADLAAVDASIVVVADIGELLEVLADNVNVSVDASMIRESKTILRKVEAYLSQVGILGAVLRSAIESWPSSSMSFHYGDSVSTKFIRVEDVHGHVIDAGETWVTARARWGVEYPVQVGRRKSGSDTVRNENWKVSFQVVSTLLFRAAIEVEEVEVLGLGKPSQISGQLEHFQTVEDPIDRSLFGYRTPSPNQSQ